MSTIFRTRQDKWFIYYQDEWLYFHRSWTGNGIYKAKLNKETDGYSIKEFWAERNHEKYQNEDDNTDIEIFSFLIARGLLGIDVGNIYSSRNIKTNSDLVKGWSNFGNMLFNNQRADYFKDIKSALFGVAVGDALGVPFEFSSRDKMEQHPATDMVGYGTYNLPPGTWSDDSSLTFCLAEAFANHGYDLKMIAFYFHMWRKNAWWTANNHVFDIGITTSQAISRLLIILEAEDLQKLNKLKTSNQDYEHENGNGSLMRILPLLFYIRGMDPVKQFDITWDVSALTHRHIRAGMSCFIYLKLAEKILDGENKNDAYETTRQIVADLWDEINFPEPERKHFSRIIQNDIRETKIQDLKSGGYVIEVLESSIWFFLEKTNYKDTVLGIINLGHDTDTSAAIAGGLAGLYYGFEDIPKDWVSQIARKEDIVDLAERFADKLASH
ncbi:MAG: ADP-ribosylglycohydrolase family protein [Chitinophagales bacterium]|nr:ADP-ribosylglycohydrolase family protein [Chitinophagales bacterium]